MNKTIDTKNWEKRFLQQFNKGCFCEPCGDYKAVKSFISTLLDEVRKEERAFIGKQRREWFMQGVKGERAEIIEKIKVYKGEACTSREYAENAHIEPNRVWFEKNYWVNRVLASLESEGEKE